MLGLIDGERLLLKDGDIEGLMLFEIEGLILGDSDLLNEGEMEGDNDLLIDGEIDGDNDLLKLGDKLFDNEGLIEGLLEGLMDGENDDTGVSKVTQDKAPSSLFAPVQVLVAVPAVVLVAVVNSNEPASSSKSSVRFCST